MGQRIPNGTFAEATCDESLLVVSIQLMKKLIILTPVLCGIALTLSSCTTVVEQPVPAATTTTTHETTVARPAATQTTTTRSSTGY